MFAIANLIIELLRLNFEGMLAKKLPVSEDSVMLSLLGQLVTGAQGY